MEQDQMEKVQKPQTKDGHPKMDVVVVKIMVVEAAVEEAVVEDVVVAEGNLFT
jgi:hypothetical protein